MEDGGDRDATCLLFELGGIRHSSWSYWSLRQDLLWLCVRFSSVRSHFCGKDGAYFTYHRRGERQWTWRNSGPPSSRGRGCAAEEGDGHALRSALGLNHLLLIFLCFSFRVSELASSINVHEYLVATPCKLDDVHVDSSCNCQNCRIVCAIAFGMRGSYRQHRSRISEFSEFAI